MTIAPGLLAGCVPQARVAEVDGRPGSLTGRLGRPGLVVAAPHATSDGRIRDIVAELGRRTGFGVVIATGFNLEPDAYERRVREVAQGPIALYTEIHGNNHRDAASRIEIATVGVDRDEAIRLRTLLELVRDAHLRANPGAQRLEILVEPADAVRYAASGARRDGILRLPQRALHIELPTAARTEWRATYTAILADFLVQAVPLPAGK